MININSQILPKVRHNKSAFFLLVVLADKMNEDRQTWHGLDSLKEKTGMSRPSLISAKKWLEENGFISIEKRQFDSDLITIKTNLIGVYSGDEKCHNLGGKKILLQGVKKLYFKDDSWSKKTLLQGVKKFYPKYYPLEVLPSNTRMAKLIDDNQLGNLLRIEKFPSQEWTRKKIKSIGEQRFLEICKTLDRYIAENPELKFKSFSGRFNTFEKNTTPIHIDQAWNVYKEFYSNLHGVTPSPKKADLNSLGTLLKSIAEDFRKDEKDVVADFKRLLEKLPEQYRRPQKLALPLLNYNYTTIKAELNTATRQQQQNDEPLNGIEFT